MRDARSLVVFLIVGGAIFLLDTGIFLSLYRFGTSPLLANAAGMLAGFVAGLFAHNHLTFMRAESVNRSVAARYFATFLANLLLASLVLKSLMYFGSGAVFAKFCAIAVATASNYVLSRSWVFKNDRTNNRA